MFAFAVHTVHPDIHDLHSGVEGFGRIKRKQVVYLNLHFAGLQVPLNDIEGIEPVAGPDM